MKKLVKYLSVVIISMLILVSLYAFLWQSEINKAYDWPTEVAQGAQRGLSAGISPNGVIEEITGVTSGIADLWEIDMPSSNPDDFIYVTETSKEYETSTDNIDIRNLAVPGDFLSETSEMGENQTTVKLPNGNRYALQAYPYSYGDVTGIVMVGRLNMPDQQKIDMYRNVAIIAWVAISVAAFVIIKPLESRENQ